MGSSIPCFFAFSRGGVGQATRSVTFTFFTLLASYIIYSVMPRFKTPNPSRQTLMNSFAAARCGLVEWLAAGETILCAEGSLLALARMGYIAHGVWVPEFILEQPELLRNVHYEFIHAGTDVTKAFEVYYCITYTHPSCYNIIYTS